MAATQPVRAQPHACRRPRAPGSRARDHTPLGGATQGRCACGRRTLRACVCEGQFQLVDCAELPGASSPLAHPARWTRATTACRLSRCATAATGCACLTAPGCARKGSHLGVFHGLANCVRWPAKDPVVSCRRWRRRQGPLDCAGLTSRMLPRGARQARRSQDSRLSFTACPVYAAPAHTAAGRKNVCLRGQAAKQKMQQRGPAGRQITLAPIIASGGSRQDRVGCSHGRGWPPQESYDAFMHPQEHCIMLCSGQGLAQMHESAHPPS
jgi:hypothetical protein